MTTYAEVGADDRDVAAFLAAQLHVLNIWSLPKAVWVARENGAIVAVMVLTNVDYPAIHLLKANPRARCFMRIFKLYKLALAWLDARHIPVVAAPVPAHLHHFQFLLRKLGFRKVGEEVTDDGQVVEVIYAYRFEERDENPVRSTA